jgi:hypothetical protein
MSNYAVSACGPNFPLVPIQILVLLAALARNVSVWILAPSVVYRMHYSPGHRAKPEWPPSNPEEKTMSSSRFLFGGLLALIGAGPLLAGSIELTNIQTFTVPFNSNTNAVSINDKGDIAGTSFVPGPQEGFIIPGNGSAPYQLVAPDSQLTYVSGINNSGIAVGYFLNGNLEDGYSLIQSFTYRNGIFVPIEGIAPLTFASGINNSGDVTGFFSVLGGTGTGFLVKNGNQTIFSVPGYSMDTYPSGVNDSDQVVGYFNAGTQGFLRNADGSFQTFDFAAYGINNAGIIVGAEAGTMDNQIGAVRVDGADYTYVYPGAQNTYLEGINNSDEVVGFFINNQNAESIFEGQLVVVPTPEPPPVSLCALALVAIFIGFRRRGNGSQSDSVI